MKSCFANQLKTNILVNLGIDLARSRDICTFMFLSMLFSLDFYGFEEYLCNIHIYVDVRGPMSSDVSVDQLKYTSDIFFRNLISMFTM